LCMPENRRTDAGSEAPEEMDRIGNRRWRQPGAPQFRPGTGNEENVSVTVLLADDHAVLREGTRLFLQRDPGLAVVGEATDGAMAIELAERLSPDVVLLDLDLPRVDGIEVTRQVCSWATGPRVLVLTGYDDQEHIRAAMEAGASGYLMKTASMFEVIAAIQAVARGEVVIHPALIPMLLGRADRTRKESLSSREMEVMRLAVRGVRNKEIAKTLFVSPRTVEAHFTSIFNKLGVTSRTEAVVKGIADGWLAAPGDAQSRGNGVRMS
jgi:DNA-binding NarL/FixJ family response regulator